MHPLAQTLADTFKSHFWSADHEITWTHTEQERMLPLNHNTFLLGRVDARGLTADGEPFFGEWKTLSNYRGRYIDDEKFKWRTDPQALTYGVLVPETKLFTVRWAIKPAEAKGKYHAKPATCDHEWYTYSHAEITHWSLQLIEIANEIRNLRTRDHAPWRTNFGNCFRWGRKCACPMFDKCSTQQWHKSMGSPRVTSHLEIENKIKNELDKYPPDLVILDASRVNDYLECPESYRNKWEGEGYNEETEALIVGKDFHGAISAHIASLIVPRVL